MWEGRHCHHLPYEAFRTATVQGMTCHPCHDTVVEPVYSHGIWCITTTFADRCISIALTESAALRIGNLTRDAHREERSSILPNQFSSRANSVILVYISIYLTLRVHRVHAGVSAPSPTRGRHTGTIRQSPTRRWNSTSVSLRYRHPISGVAWASGGCCSRLAVFLLFIQVLL